MTRRMRAIYLLRFVFSFNSAWHAGRAAYCYFPGGTELKRPNSVFRIPPPFTLK
jgi:hypothetical protein